METIIFYFLSALCIVSALMVLIMPHPIHSALSLVACMLGIAGMFVLLDAHFVAMIQLAVYAGAIMVLVLFVIMLLNVGSFDAYRNKLVWGLGFLVILPSFVLLFGQQLLGAKQLVDPLVTPIEGTVENIGQLLFTKYLFTFELASILILAALTGAILIAKPDRDKKVS